MTYQGRAALVVFNTADTESLLPQMATGWPAGTVLQGLYGLDGRPTQQVVGAGGRISLRLPPRAGWVWQVAGRSGVAARPSAAVVEPLPAAAVAGDFEVAGRAPPGMDWRLVVDGDLGRSTALSPAPDGRWQATVDTSAMVDPAVPHSLTVWSAGQPAATPREFRVRRAWQPSADIADPAGDDAGPAGQYRYPTDPGWGQRHLLDLRRIRVAQAGGALQIELTMADISAGWNPVNGFDRVAFTAFIELPGREGGATVMPLQNASLPDGMRWHLRWRAGGWSNALFEPAGASATQEGTPLTPAPQLAVDRATRTLRLTISAAALGRPTRLSGARLYVTTWDYDSGFRALAPQAQPFVFGGGPADGVKVMDDSGVIVLP
jgi:hypothetical protein